VIGRIENDRILFDPRTVLPNQDQDFLKMIMQVMERE
jgi:hypothetical protein